MPQFQPFPKIPRLRRTVTVTEKIDGTNGAVVIVPWFESQTVGSPEPLTKVVGDEAWAVYAQSRNRFVTPDQDNADFAAWVAKNGGNLVEDLGAGTHFGEWWGVGIQRGYDMSERRFSLFNTKRWEGKYRLSQEGFVTPGLHVVPTIITHENLDYAVESSLCALRNGGSWAAPGYMNPEGVVVYHHASNSMFKQTLKDDAQPKSVVEETAAA